MALSKITTESLLDGEITAAKFATNVGGRVVQVVNVTTGAVATGTTVSVNDDTIPQKTEGVEFMTLAITPTNTNNILRIDAHIVIASSDGSNAMMLGLFQDSTANAIAATRGTSVPANSEYEQDITHYMAAGTTSATTIKLRAGGSDAGTWTLNGNGGNRKFGGAMVSSMTITEILV